MGGACQHQTFLVGTSYVPQQWHDWHFWWDTSYHIGLSGSLQEHSASLASLVQAAEAPLTVLTSQRTLPCPLTHPQIQRKCVGYSSPGGEPVFGGQEKSYLLLPPSPDLSLSFSTFRPHSC